MSRMNYRIAIPSYNRSDILFEKTLSYLKECGVDNSIIDVFVANEEEYEIYKEKIPREYYGNLIIGLEKLYRQRNFITNYYPNNQPLVCLDDDVTELRVLGKDGELRKVIDDFKSIVEYGFHLMRKHSTTLCGIYAVDNPFFMNKTLSVGLYFCVGVFYLTFNDKSQNMQLTITNKDDYERTIKTYLKRGKVIRFDNITVKTNYYTERGGLQATDERTSEEIYKAGKYLIRKYPQLCEENTGRKGKYFEIKFRKQKGNKKIKL